MVFAMNLIGVPGENALALSFAMGIMALVSGIPGGLVLLGQIVRGEPLGVLGHRQGDSSGPSVNPRKRA